MNAHKRVCFLTIIQQQETKPINQWAYLLDSFLHSYIGRATNEEWSMRLLNHIDPTPPFEQDTTQGQFLSGV